MSKRSAQFVFALLASMLAGASFTAVAENGTEPADTKPADTSAADTKAADNCLSGPKGAAPAGSHWYYRLDRATKRQCWYVRAESGKAAKAVPVQPDSSAAAATAQVAAPPPQPQPDMSASVANARAELSSPQTNVARTPGTAAPGNGQRAAAPQADAQSSPVSSRWLDSSGAGASNNDAAADAAPSPQPDTSPAPQPSAVAVAPAAADSNLNRQASSTQMLLVVMIAALVLAGLIGAVVFRFGRKPAPPYDTSGEWRAPWDPLPAEQRASLPIFASGELPMRRPQAPTPRRTERIQPPADAAREEPESGITEQQIAAMLARLARSAT
jgi:hypothetical protein